MGHNFDPASGLIDIASSGNRGPNVANYFGNLGPRVGLAYSRLIPGRSGWSINGITMFQAGQPLLIGVSNNQLNNNGGGNVANITCGQVSTPKTVAEWFDTGCFAAPAPYTFGNSGIGHVRGPGIINTDLSIARETKFSEKRSSQPGAKFLFSLTVRRNGVNARGIADRASGFDAGEGGLGVAVEAQSVDAFAGGEVVRELAESFTQLAHCPHRVAALLVVERDRHVNQRLQEEAARAVLGGPLFFQNLVALEELVVVEEPDSAFQALGGHQGHCTARLTRGGRRG